MTAPKNKTANVQPSNVSSVRKTLAIYNPPKVAASTCEASRSLLSQNLRLPEHCSSMDGMHDRSNTRMPWACLI